MAVLALKIYLLVNIILSVTVVKGNDSSITPTPNITNIVTSIIDTSSITTTQNTDGTVSDMLTSSMDTSLSSTNMQMDSDLANTIQPSETILMSNFDSMDSSVLNTEIADNSMMTSFYLDPSTVTSSADDSLGMSTEPMVESSTAIDFNASMTNTVQVTPSITTESTQLDLNDSVTMSNSVVLPTMSNNDSDSLVGMMPSSVMSSPDVSSVQSLGDLNISAIVPMLSTETTDMATSTFELSPTSSQTEMTSSIIQPPITTKPTTPAPVKTTSSPTAPKEGDKENAVFIVRGKVEMKNCTGSIEQTLESQFKTIPGFLRVKIITTPQGLTCHQNSRRKRAVDVNEVEFDVVIRAKDATNKTALEAGATEAIDNLIYGGFIANDSLNNNFVSSFAALSSTSICDAEDYCPQGFKCGKVKTDGKCYSECDSEQFGGDVLCKNDGECVVEYDYNAGGLTTKCRCVAKEYYRYEGDKCETQKMTWKLIIAIAGGVAGAIIIILVFIICVVCMRSRKTEKASSELSYSPINELTMKDYRDRGSRQYDYMQSDPSMVHDQAYDNKAYDMPEDNRDMLHRESVSNGQQWDPSRSASTYAKLNSTFDDSSFQKNIKRPRVTSGMGAEHDGMTGF